MPEKPKSPSSVPEIRSEESADPSLPATVDASTAPLEPAALREGLNQLEERIPGFTHLTVKERRSRVRRATVDREFAESCIAAARKMPRVKPVLGLSGDDMQELQDLIGEWKTSIAQVRLFLRGLEDANLEREYLLGSTCLEVYAMAKNEVRFPHSRHLIPHVENMARAYARSLQKRAAKKKKKMEEPPEE